MVEGEGSPGVRHSDDTGSPRPRCYPFTLALEPPVEGCGPETRPPEGLGAVEGAVCQAPDSVVPINAVESGSSNQVMVFFAGRLGSSTQSAYASRRWYDARVPLLAYGGGDD